VVSQDERLSKCHESWDIGNLSTPIYFDESGIPIPAQIDILAIKGNRDRQRTYLINVKNHSRDLKIHKLEPNDDGMTIVRRINNVLKQLSDGYENIRRHYTSFERVDNPTAQPQFSNSGDPSTMDEDEIETQHHFKNVFCTRLIRHTSLGIADTRDSAAKKLEPLRDIVRVRGNQSLVLNSLFIHWHRRTMTSLHGNTLQAEVVCFAMSLII